MRTPPPVSCVRPFRPAALALEAISPVSSLADGDACPRRRPTPGRGGDGLDPSRSAHGSSRCLRRSPPRRAWPRRRSTKEGAEASGRSSRRPRRSRCPRPLKPHRRPRWTSVGTPTRSRSLRPTSPWHAPRPGRRMISRPLAAGGRRGIDFRASPQPTNTPSATAIVLASTPPSVVTPASMDTASTPSTVIRPMTLAATSRNAGFLFFERRHDERHIRRRLGDRAATRGRAATRDRAAARGFHFS